MDGFWGSETSILPRNKILKVNNINNNLLADCTWNSVIGYSVLLHNIYLSHANLTNRSKWLYNTSGNNQFPDSLQHLQDTLLLCNSSHLQNNQLVAPTLQIQTLKQEQRRDVNLPKIIVNRTLPRSPDFGTLRLSPSIPVDNFIRSVSEKRELGRLR